MAHISAIPDGIRPGLNITIRGQVQPTGEKFRVDLQTGEGRGSKDIPFHCSARLNEGVIVRNSKSNNVWDAEARDGSLSLRPGQRFVINISVEVDKYVVSINGQFFCEYPHRIPLNQVSHLSVYGDCSVESVTFKARQPSEQRFLTTTTEYLYSAV
ncbi:galectin-4-like [Sitophilus oryzae]|uniref:Galectin n=1 Tax=Sitophilus oryzae TaxID=7048 RepID=A0A6J2YE57_SITOR|nr:galectin-4-like [Sitophilus oryzae]